MSLVEQLVDAGIDARAYRRGPAGVRAFVASIDPHPRAGRLWIWEGRSKIDVVTNQRQRQGVLNVSEEGREVVMSLHVPAYKRNAGGRPVGFLSEQEVTDQAIRQMRGRWGLPKATHYEGRIKFMPKSIRTGSMAQVTVRAIAPASDTSLLVGMDETHHFVAQLPRFGVTSVLAAHRLLRPTEARVPGTKRQGEWFFVPVRNVALLKTLHARQRRFGRAIIEPLEPRSSHRALVVHWENRTYAIGTVVDSRTGRHAPLLLPDFHRVVRNREVNVVPTHAVPQRRYWD